ncbi:antibiotic biosynthesis monooxygenase family protein [Rhodococcus sp. LB1]|uniref:antibiotic biosynthesis monooxygenase family protein n=1 Tax=Rhodococcus sp. LB1 TaxID=1807499 RepID=UPI00077AF8E7|nr:antibiotic biosynthesis monooxygenase family protein [Rhodococcus sp. LB1]KXX55880.1 hypothetical protein AZG88_02285 [Rhodococcus sp. LB1]
MSALVRERAEITITAGKHAEFEAAAAQGLKIVAEQRGFRSATLSRGVENLNTYLLLVEWDSVADHTEGFVGSPDFARWRALVGPYYAAPPTVHHYTHVRW